MIAPVAVMFQSDEPWPFWKMKTMIPNAAASEMRLRIAALSASTIERNARVEQDQREHQHEREHVGEVPVHGVHEVAVDGRHAAERAARSRAARRWRGR